MFFSRSSFCLPGALGLIQVFKYHGERNVWKTEIIKEEVTGDILTWNGLACCCHSLTWSDLSWKILKIVVSHLRLSDNPYNQMKLPVQIKLQLSLEARKIQSLRTKVMWFCIYNLLNNSRWLKRDTQQQRSLAPGIQALASTKSSFQSKELNWMHIHPDAARANTAKGKAFQDQLKIITDYKPDRDSCR